MKSVNGWERQMICEEIWNLTRSALLKKYPFFRLILLRFVFQMDENTHCAGTDGRTIFYHPEYLMRLYQKSEKEVEQLFLHMLYHCLFLHIIMEEKEDKRRWHRACDLAVKHLMNEAEPRQIDPVFLYENFEMADTELEETENEKSENLFSMDDHQYWKRVNQDEMLEIAEKQWNQIQRHTGGNGVGAIAAGIGCQAGNQKEEMKIQKSGTCDFRSYLRKFAVSQEELETDTESFDYIPYLYGMEHYGNMPLIEYLEYKEVKKLEELVIAIDTSGSCKTDTVRRFMEETYGILSDHENFFRKMNVYIIQCDFQVQHTAHITSEEQWKHYMEELVIHGRSGTDFRPVFQYVDTLKKQQKLKNLCGLLYFTDGDGIYPEKEPEYETAFVFYHEKSSHQKVPVWAKQMTLEDEDEY